MFNIEHTSDPETLRSVIRLLDAEVRRLQTQVKDTTRLLAELSTKDKKEIENQALLIEVELSKRLQHAYSGGSERRPRDKPPKKPDPNKRSKKGSRRTEQKELPIEDVKQTLDEADRACPCCGGHLEEWAGKADTSEVIDVRTVRYKLIRQELCKYRCRCGHIETAMGIQKLTAGGRYTVDFAIHVILSRYVDLIPLDRLRKIMSRSGLCITSQTLWDQVFMVANLLSPAKARLLELIREEKVVIADETRWPLLGGRSGKNLEKKHDSKNWYIWAIIGSNGVVYEIQNSRSNEAGEKLIGDFSGVLLADGYVVYRSLAKNGAFILAHDWTHVRRRFIEAEASDPELAMPFIEDIGKLFLIEREIAERVRELCPKEAQELRKQVRDEKSKPIVARIGKCAAEVRTLKESPMGRALTYLENRWEGLQVFLTHPQVPITSNAIERALRDPVVARKVTLGSRSERGIEATSILTSLLETAKLHGVNLQQYLKAAISAALDNAPIPLPHELVV